MKKVIVTGAAGEIGSYMVDFLLKETNYEVYAVARVGCKTLFNLNDAFPNHRCHLIYGDLLDKSFVRKLISRLHPDYFINLAAQATIEESKVYPYECFQINTLAVIDILQNIVHYSPNCRVFSAGSIKQFEGSKYISANIRDPQMPLSIYADSKVATFNICNSYRNNHGIYVVTGMLGNSESPRRSLDFVSRKITSGIARIKNEMKYLHQINPLVLYNFYAFCDWSYAGDIVNGIWKMLNQLNPKNYILSSGETHSVKEFVEIAFDFVEINGFWEQSSSTDICFRQKGTGLKLAVTDKEHYCPANSKILCGDSSEIKEELGWRPTVNFQQLIYKMLQHDLKLTNQKYE